MLDFRLLGPFEVVDGDRILVIGPPRQRALLTILVLNRGALVSSERLIDQLWGEQPPPTATKIVQGYVSHLRRVLGDGVLLTRGGGYLLVAADEQVDAARFEQLAASARSALEDGHNEQARARLSAALRLWRGDALADLAYEGFAQPEVSRLEELRLAALEDRIDAELRLGSHRAVVAELEVLVRGNPFRERLLGHLMLALYRSGRQAEALDAYRRGRRALHDELGLVPGPELRALEQRILSQDPDLELTPAPTTPESDVVAVPAALRPEGRARRGSLLLVLGGLMLLAVAVAALVAQIGGGAAPSIRVSGNSVAAIDVRTNRVDAAIAVGAGPAAIAYGAGSLWVANVEDQTVSRVDPHTMQTLRTIALGQPPTGITAAGGEVWAVTSGTSQSYVSVSQIDPRFDAVDRTVHVGNVAPATAAAIGTRGDQLWVAPFSGDLTRLRPATGAVLRRIDPNAAPAALAVGSGALWVTDSEADTVIRAGPFGLMTTIDVGHQPDGIAIGDGGVWVADTGDNAVVRIDPNTRAVITTIRVGDNPLGVAVGDGSVWVANSGDGTVSRIDPRTNLVTATVAVGGSPQAVTVADGRAWVTVDPSVFPSTVAASGGTLRVDAAYDVDYMDPALAYEPLSASLLYATCTQLVNYPDRSGAAATELVPEVARSMPAVTDGGRTYTFVVRRGFRFAPPSDQPVTAQVFKDTIERTLSPVMKSPVASELDDVVGARAYIAGRAEHISGVVVHGARLIIHLIAPDPVLLNLLAESFFCAVPSDTPRNPRGVRIIPFAGPYTTASYTPGQGVVLVRNPNYHGARPHHFARIEVSVNVPGARAVAQVEAGKADYAFDGELQASEAPRLAARYGAGSPAARRGHQQYFVNAESQLDFYVLNTHRSLFSHQRLREAVNYAVNRTALANLGDMHSTFPDQPIDQYLPPGIPGYRDVDVYPSTPDLAKARKLAKGFAGSTVVLYTCDRQACAEQAQVIRNDLAAIDLHVVIKTFSVPEIYTLYNVPGERYDMGLVWWSADYPDPYDFTNLLLEGGEDLPKFKDPAVARQLAAAARMTGVNRYLRYEQLDRELAETAAPWIVFGDSSTHELFSARIGCQVYSPLYATDLAALCVRSRIRRHRA